MISRQREHTVNFMIIYLFYDPIMTVTMDSLRE